MRDEKRRLKRKDAKKKNLPSPRFSDHPSDEESEDSNDSEFQGGLPPHTLKPMQNNNDVLMRVIYDLMRAEADPNLCNLKGYTPLVLAVVNSAVT